MNFIIDELLLRGLAIDEIFSGNYESRPGVKSRADQSAARLAEWAKACSGGDWSLFVARLSNDNLSLETVLQFFSEATLKSEATNPDWMSDAVWIYGAFKDRLDKDCITSDESEALPFEELFHPIVTLASEILVSQRSADVLDFFALTAKDGLKRDLLKGLTDLAAPILYINFVNFLKSCDVNGKLLPSDTDNGISKYVAFIQGMHSAGLLEIFNEYPVLLRLIAVVTRQWINSTAEVMDRVTADQALIRKLIACPDYNSLVSRVDGGMSDAHNMGRAVRIINFTDGSRAVYKPKDLRVDVAWEKLINHLNKSGAPVVLRVAKTIVCDGYGWMEFIEHTQCDNLDDVREFYKRSGAWLIIFHIFASSDMHFENIIASGAHPVPIDLEMILQSSYSEKEQDVAQMRATNMCSEKIANSVLTVGMLPAYSRSAKNKILDAGGLNAVGGNTIVGKWKNINSNGMRWVQLTELLEEFPNVPYLNGSYVKFGDFLENFIDGFEGYAHFLLREKESIEFNLIFQDFCGLPVRKVLRPTRFYDMLMQRLKDHKRMRDGITWSSQADFLARFSDSYVGRDLLWPLQKGERLALLNLNIPHFTSLTDDTAVFDGYGNSAITITQSGYDKARQRIINLSPEEIVWQKKVITISTSFVPSTEKINSAKLKYGYDRKSLDRDLFTLTDRPYLSEAHKIFKIIQKYAYTNESSANWIGLDWLADSDVGQLIPLGPDLYSGVSGIALFLAAYSRVNNDFQAKDLALRAMSSVRYQINSPLSARWARTFGIGGASGLGSVIYALTNISLALDDDQILDDAVKASRLITNDLISSDQSLDVIDGSAGAILGLLALYGACNRPEVLSRAIACGEHLLESKRVGDIGTRSWVGMGLGDRPLNGMSHGAAGYALALSKLAHESGREDFLSAANECIAYEQSNYDALEHNWPDERLDESGDGSYMKNWICQWCHGAPGIGLAHISRVKLGGDYLNEKKVVKDAIECVKKNWPNRFDTLCCGTMGSIEFLNEASKLLADREIDELSDARMKEIIQGAEIKGDYIWNAGGVEFNLGLFKGISGVGYTLIRRVDPSLPNVLTWD